MKSPTSAACPKSVGKVTEMAKSVQAYDIRGDFKRQGLMPFVPEGSKRTTVEKGKIPKHGKSLAGGTLPHLADP